MKNKFGWTRWRTYNLRDELIWGWTPSGDKRLVYHCAIRKIQYLHIFSIKKESIAIIDALILFTLIRCCWLYLSAIEILICLGEMSLIRSASFGFAQNIIHDFQNTKKFNKCHNKEKMVSHIFNILLLFTVKHISGYSIPLKYFL